MSQAPWRRQAPGDGTKGAGGVYQQPSSTSVTIPYAEIGLPRPLHPLPSQHLSTAPQGAAVPPQPGGSYYHPAATQGRPVYDQSSSRGRFGGGNGGSTHKRFFTGSSRPPGGRPDSWRGRDRAWPGQSRLEGGGRPMPQQAPVQQPSASFNGVPKEMHMQFHPEPRYSRSVTEVDGRSRTRPPWPSQQTDSRRNSVGGSMGREGYQPPQTTNRIASRIEPQLVSAQSFAQQSSQPLASQTYGYAVSLPQQPQFGTQPVIQQQSSLLQSQEVPVQSQLPPSQPPTSSTQALTDFVKLLMSQASGSVTSEQRSPPTTATPVVEQPKPQSADRSLFDMLQQLQQQVRTQTAAQTTHGTSYASGVFHQPHSQQQPVQSPWSQPAPQINAPQRIVSQTVNQPLDIHKVATELLATVQGQTSQIQTHCTPTSIPGRFDVRPDSQLQYGASIAQPSMHTALYSQPGTSQRVDDSTEALLARLVEELSKRKGFTQPNESPRAPIPTMSQGDRSSSTGWGVHVERSGWGDERRRPSYKRERSPDVRDRQRISEDIRTALPLSGPLQAQLPFGDRLSNFSNHLQPRGASRSPGVSRRRPARSRSREASFGCRRTINERRADRRRPGGEISANEDRKRTPNNASIQTSGRWDSRKPAVVPSIKAPPPPGPLRDALDMLQPGFSALRRPPTELLRDLRISPSPMRRREQRRGMSPGDRQRSGLWDRKSRAGARLGRGGFERGDRPRRRRFDQPVGERGLKRGRDSTCWKTDERHRDSFSSAAKKKRGEKDVIENWMIGKTVKDIAMNERLLPKEFLWDMDDKKIDLRRENCRLWIFTALRAINKTADSIREALTALNRSAKQIDRCLPCALITGLPNIGCSQLQRSLSQSLKERRVAVHRVSLSLYYDTGLCQGWGIIEPADWKSMEVLMRFSQFEWRGMGIKIRPLTCPQLVHVNSHLTLVAQHGRPTPNPDISEWSINEYKSLAKEYNASLVLALSNVTGDTQSTPLGSPSILSLLTSNKRLFLSVPSIWPSFSSLVEGPINQKKQQNLWVYQQSTMPFGASTTQIGQIIPPAFLADTTVNNPVGLCTSSIEGAALQTTVQTAETEAAQVTTSSEDTQEPTVTEVNTNPLISHLNKSSILEENEGTTDKATTAMDVSSNTLSTQFNTVREFIGNGDVCSLEHGSGVDGDMDVSQSDDDQGEEEKTNTPTASTNSMQSQQLMEGLQWPTTSDTNQMSSIAAAAALLSPQVALSAKMHTSTATSHLHLTPGGLSTLIKQATQKLEGLPTTTINNEVVTIKPLPKEDDLGFLSLFSFGSHPLLSFELLCEFGHQYDISRSITIPSCESHCWAANLQHDHIDCLQVLESLKALDILKSRDDIEAAGINDSLYRLSNIEEVPYIMYVTDLPNMKSIDLIKGVHEALLDILEQINSGNNDDRNNSSCNAVNIEQVERTNSSTNCVWNKSVNDFWGPQLFRFAETNRLRGDGLLLLPATIESKLLLSHLSSTATSFAPLKISSIERPVFIRRYLSFSSHIDLDLNVLCQMLQGVSTTLFQTVKKLTEDKEKEAESENVRWEGWIKWKDINETIGEVKALGALNGNWEPFKKAREKNKEVEKQPHNDLNTCEEQVAAKTTGDNVDTIMKDFNDDTKDNEDNSSDNNNEDKNVYDPKTALLPVHLISTCQYSTLTVEHLIKTHFFSLEKFFDIIGGFETTRISSQGKIEQEVVTPIRTIVIQPEMKNKFEGLANHTIPNLYLPNDFRAITILKKIDKILGAVDELVDSSTGLPTTVPLSLENFSMDPTLLTQIFDLLNRYLEANFPSTAPTTTASSGKSFQVFQWLMFENEPDWVATLRVPSIICEPDPTITIGTPLFELTGDVCNSSCEAKLNCTITFIKYMTELENKMLEKLDLQPSELEGVVFKEAPVSPRSSAQQQIEELKGTRHEIPEILSEWDYYEKDEVDELELRMVDKNLETRTVHEFWNPSLLKDLECQGRFRYVPLEFFIDTPRHRYELERLVQRLFRIHEKGSKATIHDISFNPESEDVILAELLSENLISKQQTKLQPSETPLPKAADSEMRSVYQA